MKHQARLTALKLLRQVFVEGKSLGDAERVDVPGDARDAAYARHLAYGVLRWYSALDWLAARMLQKPLKARDRDIQWLLAIGLFQLWKDDTPRHAAVHETAECARSIGKAWAVGLINAVLRRFVREQDALLEQLETTDQQYAFPGWLLERLKNDWPGVGWKSAVNESNRPAPLWLRLNARTDSQTALQELQQAGFETSRHAHAPDAVRVEPAAPVHALPGFSAGSLSVQDPAAQLAAGLLPVTTGARVLDACAAPGGKTCHLLERHPDIQLTALDRSASRLDKVQQNLDRCGLSGATGTQLLAADAAATGDWWNGQAFRSILLDAPCTATGVIRRHPEIKWLRSPAQVDEATRMQERLLGALWPLLEPGGALLYATCSILHAENRDQVQRFIEAHSDARLQPLDVAWGRDTGYGRQILPGDDDMDGFFYALLVRER
jgi:16S rRNA (cytosine967-C5)-methyltransferase